jgi:hypothetical protein
VIALIAAIDRPMSNVISVSQKPLADVQATMEMK